MDHGARIADFAMNAAVMVVTNGFSSFAFITSGDAWFLDFLAGELKASPDLHRRKLNT